MNSIKNSNNANSNSSKNQNKNKNSHNCSAVKFLKNNCSRIYVKYSMTMMTNRSKLLRIIKLTVLVATWTIITTRVIAVGQTPGIKVIGRCTILIIVTIMGVIIVIMNPWRNMNPCLPILRKKKPCVWRLFGLILNNINHHNTHGQ